MHALHHAVIASEAKQSELQQGFWIASPLAMTAIQVLIETAIMSLVIRPARPGEYDAIAKLWMESWCSTGLEAPSDKLLAILQARVPREISDGWSLYVAGDDVKLAAMLAVHVPKLYLDQLMIAPSYQGQSLGRRLLGFTRALLPDEIWLRCAEGNEKAWRWYERENFVLEKEAVDPTHGRLMKYYRWKRTEVST